MPMDPVYPADRLAYMAEVADLTCLLTDSALLQSDTCLPEVAQVRLCNHCQELHLHAALLKETGFICTAHG